MAVLQNGDLSLDIAYRSYELGGVEYDITLRWRGVPVLNDAILKRSGEYWANRGVGSITTDAGCECGVLPLLRRALETNMAVSWEPDDPDILLIIRPGYGSSFLVSGTRGGAGSSEEKAHVETLERERRERKPTPGDGWEIVVFVDAYTFEGAGGYYDSGLCFCLATTREGMQHFYAALKQEYQLFRTHWKVQEENEARWGPGYQPPEF